MEVLAEFGALYGQSRAGLPAVEGHRKRLGVLIPLQRPEIVPVRMHWLLGIPLVTDRCGKQAVQGAPIGGEIGLPGWGGRARLEGAGGGSEVGPPRPEEPRMVGVAKKPRREKDQPPAAVVFGDGIRTAVIDAAGDFAIVELVGRVPSQEVGGDIRVAESQQ